MRVSIFFLAEFIETIFLSGIVATIFLGGWHVPGLHEDGFSFLKLPHIAVVLIHLVAWTLKVLFLCWLQLLIRWTLPRFRPDQLMRLGWKQLLPASLFNIVVTAGLMLVFAKGGK